jgi:hypothetical protein
MLIWARTGAAAVSNAPVIVVMSKAVRIMGGPLNHFEPFLQPGRTVPAHLSFQLAGLGLGEIIKNACSLFIGTRP